MSDEREENPSGFTLWAVWRRNPDVPVTESDSTELETIVSYVEDSGVTVRGFYGAAAHPHPRLERDGRAP